ncbi:solute carrier family 25 member 35-like isoform X2 [Onthophagus taurus]|uniref:solute carrier family 25 member 35-like isoform X2 n=1 Tax=Onthophagus taurus TaxID=166361 RepID=UPI0039BE51F0
MEFLIGGLAATSACIFTHPLEVLKIRLQLQGELKSKGKHPIVYKNSLHAAYLIAKHEGMFALQKGLVTGLWVQLIMNGSRLGFYDFWSSRGYDTNKKTGEKMIYRSVFIAGTGGVIGHYLSNPFYLIKTHLQSESAKAIAVGYQHHYKGTWNALKDTFRKHGLNGLFRGGVAVVPRAFVASSSQLVSFLYVKDWLNKTKYFSKKPVLTVFLGSMIGGISISVMTAPFDLILIRLYNQGVDKSGKGTLYSGYFDCIKKIYTTEGFSAFYKGVGPMYFRLGPHTVLCLMFWEVYKKIYHKYCD